MTTDDDDFIKSIERELQFRVTARGEFLDHMALIENTINQIIARHFCSVETKQTEFEELILRNNMMLGNKITLLNSILRNNYSGILAKEPNLMPKLDKLNQFRTKLAHGIGVSDGVGVAPDEVDSFQLALYKKGKLTIERITKKDIEKEYDDLLYIDGILAEIHRRVLTTH
jgi:hypothetical protein